MVNWVSSSAKPPRLQPRDQMDQATFEASRSRREHAFAEERRAERHAVEAADQLAVPPGLDRVAVAAREELAIELADRRVDPGLRRGPARGSAQPSITAVEIVIDADLEDVLRARLRQALAARGSRRAE